MKGDTGGEKGEGDLISGGDYLGHIQIKCNM